ncbi:MAG: fructosamine kinase family protein [Thiohalocapsa sp.]
MSTEPEIARQIADATGQPFAPRATRTVGGGCINRALVLSDGDQHWFVKVNQPALLAMFEAESDGLAAMAETASIRVPRPVCTGIADGQAFIAMEYVALGGGGGRSGALAGERLAAMHRTTAADFGWHRDNTIGSTPQRNERDRNWVRFWQRHRLGFQLDLAARNGYRGRLADRGALLLERLPALLDHAPRPSLLHGDLWGGNMGVADDGSPVIFDPACYYGDREADLAMTELFGGFGANFYAAYDAAWPLEAGYRTRKTLYNLYHILNHLNLFGSGYRSQAETMVDRLLSELG